MSSNYRTALIVGAGSGLSASLARLFGKNGMRVALAARSPEKLGALAAAQHDQVDAMFFGHSRDRLLHLAVLSQHRVRYTGTLEELLQAKLVLFSQIARVLRQRHLIAAAVARSRVQAGEQG